VPIENIDTDQIIPAQFLTTTEREGLGQFCFYGWRFAGDGSDKADNPLLDYQPKRQQVLVAGTNFGCGSSREHAPWALLDFGFRAIISDRFADIFRNNALKNGLLPITVDDDVIKFLHAHPDHAVSIDIRTRTLAVDGLGEYTFPIDPFAAFCLTRGIDQLDFILENEQDISAYEHRSNK
jgi:3-isopropylmalate/(R)-2-methylmalate dehydratase small subunit